MLIATPGQTATYALAAGLSKKTVTTTSNHQSTSTNSNTNPSSHNNINNLNSNSTQLGHNNKFTFNSLKNVIGTNACRDVAHHPSGTVATSSLFMSKDKTYMEATPKQSSNRTASNLVKSLTVRLSRGTETLKATVQKALLAASAVSGVTSGLIEMSSSNRTATCNNVLTTSKATVTAKINTTTSHTILSTLKSSADLSSSSSLQSNAVPNNSNNSNNTISSSSRNNNSSVTALAATNRKYPSAAFLKLYTIPPTIYHRFPNENKQCNRGSGSSSSRNSTDSLHMEMCHFKPIRTVPVTLWKSGSKSRGCPMRFPTARTEMHVNKNCDVMHKKEANRHSLNMNIVAVSDDVCVNLRPQPSSSAVLLSRVLTTSSRRSAFVCLVAQMKQLKENHSTTSAKRCAQSKRKSCGDLHKIRGARRGTKDLIELPVATKNTRKSKSIANVPLSEDCGGPPKTKSRKSEINKAPGRSTRSSTTNILKRSPGRSSTKTSKPLLVSKSKTKSSVGVASKLKKNIRDTASTTAPTTLPVPVRKRAKYTQGRKLKGIKTKVVDIVKLVQEMGQSPKTKNISVGPVAPDERKTANFQSRTTRKSVSNSSTPNQRVMLKRKFFDEESTANHTSRAAKSRALTYKPSTAMSKKVNPPSPNQANKAKRGVKPIVPINQKKARPSSNRLTPPLTRGRLKQLSESGNFTFDFQQLKA